MQSWIDGHGQFAFDELPPGRFQVDLRRIMPDGRDVPVRVAGGQQVTVENAESTITLETEN